MFDVLLCSMVDDYYSFKRDLLLKTEGLPFEAVRAIVSEYESVIDSKRRCSCIKDCYDLILILEKRCHVCPEDYFELKNIINYLSEEDKNIMLARLDPQRVTFGDFSNNNGTQNESTHSTSQAQKVTDNKLPEHVLKLISNEIGVKWRDFARKLGLREGDLVNIERQYPKDYKMCAYESLLIFQAQSMKQNLRQNLLRALEKARRKDLQHAVQEIFNYTD